jgi:hypothetical protein
VAYFDNSSENPNPHDSPKPVGWGEKTTDEMCIAFVSFLKADQWQPREDEFATRAAVARWNAR